MVVVGCLRWILIGQKEHVKIGGEERMCHVFLSRDDVAVLFPAVTTAMTSGKKVGYAKEN